jgi:RNA polymerase sigma factor (sigma-70 family)
MTTPISCHSHPRRNERSSPAFQAYADTDLADVLRAKSGDRTALLPLWEKHWGSLYGYFARHVRRREEAEDLTSDTLLAAFDQLPAFRGLSTLEAEVALSPGEAGSPPQNGTFQAYLRAIARNKLAGWMRSKTGRPCCPFTEMEADDAGGSTLEDRLGTDAEADPLIALLRQERQDEVCYALADVGLRSYEQFTVLVYHYMCDRPHKVVANLFSTRHETINTRLQEGRRTLLRHYHRADHNAAAHTVSC